jgi:predicted PurR-regulated permease PerM
MILNPHIISYILVVFALWFTLSFHLLPAAFAGMTVYVVTTRIADRFPVRWGGIAHKLALAAIVIAVIAALLGIGIGIWSFLHGSKGMSALLVASAEIIDNIRRQLPSEISDYMPQTMDDVREQTALILREHARNISSAGMTGLKTLLHIIFGTIIGGLTAIHHFDGEDRWPPIVTALHKRIRQLATAFERIVFAQIKISLFNTFLTAIYLMLILPLFGYRLPFSSILIPLTFILGMLPIVGNVLSNTIIVVLSSGISLHLAAFSLLFLIVIHKLEYFINARIMGGEIRSSAWEMLLAMLTMEAAFGMAGVVAAPIVYAWIKSEIIQESEISD